MWFIRPCPVTLMKAMALAVVHLQPLRLVLMDTLMVDYMTLVDSYINSSQYEPDELQHVGKVSQKLAIHYALFHTSCVEQLIFRI